MFMEAEWHIDITAQMVDKNSKSKNSNNKKKHNRKQKQIKNQKNSRNKHHITSNRSQQTQCNATRVRARVQQNLRGSAMIKIFNANAQKGIFPPSGCLARTRAKIFKIKTFKIKILVVQANVHEVLTLLMHSHTFEALHRSSLIQ